MKFARFHSVQLHSTEDPTLPLRPRFFAFSPLVAFTFPSHYTFRKTELYQLRWAVSRVADRVLEGIRHPSQTLAVAWNKQKATRETGATGNV